MPDNESSAKIDTAISEAIEQSRQRIKDLDAEVERMERGAANSDTAVTEAFRQLVKDLDAAVQRIRGARRKY
jgi:soluble cytochrome b562